MRRDKAPQKRSHHTAAAATTTWDLSSPSNSFLEQDTVDGGELEMALGTCDEPWEDRAGKSQKRLNFRTMTGQMNSHQMTQSWKIILALWKQQRPMP